MMGNLLNLKQGQPLNGALVVPVVEAMSANGAVSIPDAGWKYIPVTKAGVCAMTLAAPSAAQDGVVLVFFSTTAQAHTLTATTIGFNDGGASGDVATFGGAKGDGLMVVAYNGDWWILNSINITLA